MTVPQIVTYAADAACLRCAISNGADHIILEDSKLAVRSYSDDFSQCGFEKIATLAALARELNPRIQLSVQVDKLLHHRHMPLLAALLETCISSGLHCFRVQDPGLVSYIVAAIPEARIHLASETGYANAHGISALLRQRPQIERVVLSNDWSQNVIAQVGNSLDVEMEYQVHGAMLLQYTDRRLLAGYEAQSPSSQASSPQASIDPDDIPSIGERRVRVEDRDYRFYDTPHGNCMYASFDKSLYTYIPALMALSLHGWLCDARGESIEYFAAMLDAYRSGRDSYLCAADEGADMTAYSVASAPEQRLQACARRTCKPGFFIANNTDYVFESQAQDHRQRRYVGKIIDSMKTKSFCIEAYEDLEAKQYKVSTPEGKEKIIRMGGMRHLSGDTCTQCPAGEHVIVPWTKGLYVDCLLYVEDDNDTAK